MKSLIIANRFIESYEWERFPKVRFRPGTNSISWNVIPKQFCDSVEKCAVIYII